MAEATWMGGRGAVRRGSPCWSRRTLAAAWAVGVLPFVAVVLLAAASRGSHSPLRPLTRVRVDQPILGMATGGDRRGEYLAVYGETSLQVIWSDHGVLRTQCLPLSWPGGARGVAELRIRDSSGDGLADLLVVPWADRHELADSDEGTIAAVYTQRSGGFQRTWIGSLNTSEPAGGPPLIVVDGQVCDLEVAAGKRTTTRLIEAKTKRRGAMLLGYVYAAGDLDEDGTPELLSIERDFAGRRPPVYRLFRGRGPRWGCVWEQTQAAATPGEGTWGGVLAQLVDFDLDGRGELAVYNSDAHAVDLLTWQGD